MAALATIINGFLADGTSAAIALATLSVTIGAIVMVGRKL